MENINYFYLWLISNYLKLSIVSSTYDLLAIKTNWDTNLNGPLTNQATNFILSLYFC